jgi:O-antigen ligase
VTAANAVLTKQAEEGHALSVDPPATWRGLASFTAFAFFLLGTARAVDDHQSRQLARGIMILGVVLALAGIVQGGASTKVYGIWLPYYRGRPFGPFVNANHFAGWMLMAIPVSIGYFCATLSRRLAAVDTGWRQRLLWVSSRHANQLVLMCAAILLMAVSLVMTLSRSGIICFLITLLIVAMLALKRRAQGVRRAVVALSLLSLAVFSFSAAGMDAVTDRFTAADTLTLSGRTSIWADTVRMTRQYPLVGTGLNTYATAMASYQTGNLDFSVLEAHNDYLQVAAEGGILVGGAAVTLIALFLREVKRGLADSVAGSMDYWVRVGAVAGCAAIGLQELGEFSLQIPGNAALFVVLCSLAVHGSSRRPKSSHTSAA